MFFRNGVYVLYFELLTASLSMAIISLPTQISESQTSPLDNKEPIVLVSAFYQKGTASYYGASHHGKTTSNGESFDMNAMTAAHPTLKFGTVVNVKNQNNGKSVRVRINDRGPYSGGRVIDLSLGAAKQLGMTKSGTAPVVITK
jgi:rare lipoprotein A